MNALNKEKIFEELRNYHTQQFPAKIKNPVMDNLRNEFAVMEDRIVGMILSLVSGKSEFVDSTNELNSFQAKVKTSTPENEEHANKNIFAAKISKLAELVSFAKESGFKLKTVRGAKVV